MFPRVCNINQSTFNL